MVNCTVEKVQASVSLPRNLPKRESIEEILSSQKSIDEKNMNLGNEKPEELNAVNDGGIQFVPGKINVNEIVDNLGYVEGKFILLRYCYHR